MNPSLRHCRKKIFLKGQTTLLRATSFPSCDPEIVSPDYVESSSAFIHSSVEFSAVEELLSDLEIFNNNVSLIARNITFCAFSFTPFSCSISVSDNKIFATKSSGRSTPNTSRPQLNK